MLNGFRAEKRMIRKEIRNFIVLWEEDLTTNYGIRIPQNIKNMPKRDFELWLETISRTNVPESLKELLVQYDCACANITSCEEENVSL